MSRRRAREVALQSLVALDILDQMDEKYPNEKREEDDEETRQKNSLLYAFENVDELGEDLGAQKAPDFLNDKQRTVNYAKTLLAATRENLAQIDANLEKFSHDWKVSRMPTIDRNILRLAICELQFIPKKKTDKTTPSVIINEALEIAKSFSDEKSVSFINGILGNFVPKKE